MVRAGLLINDARPGDRERGVAEEDLIGSEWAVVFAAELVRGYSFAGEHHYVLGRGGARKGLPHPWSPSRSRIDHDHPYLLPGGAPNFRIEPWIVARSCPRFGTGDPNFARLEPALRGREPHVALIGPSRDDYEQFLEAVEPDPRGRWLGLLAFDEFTIMQEEKTNDPPGTGGLT